MEHFLACRLEHAFFFILSLLHVMQSMILWRLEMLWTEAISDFDKFLDVLKTIKINPKLSFRFMLKLSKFNEFSLILHTWVLLYFWRFFVGVPTYKPKMIPNWSNRSPRSSDISCWYHHSTKSYGHNNPSVPTYKLLP